MADNKTQIIITAKDQASSVISTISKNLKVLSGTSLEVGKSMLGAAAGVAGIAGGIGMMDAAINGYIAQENAVKQMEARLKSTGMAAGYNSQQLQDMATALQKTTTFGDDATISAQSLMLTFTKISGPVFGDAIAAAQNMSVALGQDLNGSVLQLGKALNDPIHGITALSRAGVSFTEGQKATIKSLVESGDLMGAQTIILKELEVEFGGAATAARDTLGGALTSLGNTVGDLLENIVGSGVKKGGLVGAINSLNTALEDAAPALAQTGGVLSRVWDGFIEDMVRVDIILSRIKGGAYQAASIVGGPWRKEMMNKGSAWFAGADSQSAWLEAKRAGEMPGTVLDASEMGRLHAMQGVASKHGSGAGGASMAGSGAGTGATKKDNFTVDAPGYMNWRREADMIKQEAAYIEQLIKDQEAAMGSITVDDPGFMGWRADQKGQEQESAYIATLAKAQQEKDQLLQIEERFNQQMLASKMGLAEQSLALLAETASEGSALQIGAMVAMRALAVAQIIMNTHAAASAALLPPPIGLGPIAGQAMSAQILGMGYANAALTGAVGIMQIANSNKREYGGPVIAGQSYLVGEKRAEIFTPNQSGWITPRAGSGGGFTQHVTIDARGADTGVLARIDVAMRRAKEEAKADIMNSLNRGSSYARAVGRA